MTPNGRVLFLDWGFGYREFDPQRLTVSKPLEIWLDPDRTRRYLNGN
ncbi:MAG: hypothetical protein ACO1SV_03675 [Fimbriimonas sp.]